MLIIAYFCFIYNYVLLRIVIIYVYNSILGCPLMSSLPAPRDNHHNQPTPLRILRCPLMSSLPPPTLLCTKPVDYVNYVSGKMNAYL